MNLLLRSSAVAILGLSAAAANATITLPSNTSTTRFDGGTMVFATSELPTVNPTSGVINSPTGNLQLLAFGDINHIVNVPNSVDTGSIAPDEQLTFALTNAFLHPTATAVASGVDGLGRGFVTYDISSTVTGANNTGGPTLTLYDRSTPTAGDRLNSLSYKGTSAASFFPAGTAPTAATNGPVFLEFANMNGVTAQINVKFFTDPFGSTITHRQINFQIFSAGNQFDLSGAFPVTGGSASGIWNLGQSLTGNQLGAAGATGNTSAPIFFEGNYALDVTRQIPEPASLALLAVGGLLIGFRGRKAVRQS